MKTALELLQQKLRMPLVAILRGLEVSHAVAVGEALVESGFRAIEVPLNRAGALECIELLVQALPQDVLVGGGTMLTVADVDAVHRVGGRLMVAPNCDARVIARAVALGMFCAPGVATPTEAFVALEAGAHALKVFPAEMVGYQGLKALLSILPAGTEVWPVGGITPDNIPLWKAVGATGFGIGSQLYTAGKIASDVRDQGCRYVQAWRDASQ